MSLTSQLTDRPRRLIGRTLKDAALLFKTRERRGDVPARAYFHKTNGQLQFGGDSSHGKNSEIDLQKCSASPALSHPTPANRKRWGLAAFCFHCAN